MNLKKLTNRISDSSENYYNQLSIVLGNLSIADRREFLKTFLKGYSRITMISPTFGKVLITAKGIDETAHHASKSVQSTLAAMQLRKVVETAEWDGQTYTPKSGNQTKRFNFDDIYNLFTTLENIGRVKLTIGKNKKGIYIQYCCTSD